LSSACCPFSASSTKTLLGQYQSDQFAVLYAVIHDQVFEDGMFQRTSIVFSVSKVIMGSSK
jgi:hypothetical protein